MQIRVMPREKLLREGAAVLTDEELLAIFLRTGTSGQSVLQLAVKMLDHFGGIYGVLNASYKDFCAIKGLGMAKFCQLQATFELTKRCFNMKNSEDKVFTDVNLVERFLLHNFEQTQHERFACLFLNSKNHLISFEYLFQGSINKAEIYPRTIAQYCLRMNAAAVIFAHNHPSGDVSPSDSDQRLTRHLIDVLKLIDVNVLDHFILGFNKSFSMAKHGVL